MKKPKVKLANMSISQLHKQVESDLESIIMTVTLMLGFLAGWLFGGWPMLVGICLWFVWYGARIWMCFRIVKARNKDYAQRLERWRTEGRWKESDE